MADKNINIEQLKVPYIAWEISPKCNLGCQFCYSSSWNYNRIKGKYLHVLSADKIKSGIDKLYKLGLDTKYISWTGGEVLLLKDNLKEIFKYSSQKGFKNVLTTNGMFTPLFKNKDTFKKYLFDLAPYLDWISLSLDGEDEESNNNMRLDINGKPSKYHYKDVLETLNMVKSLNYPFKIKITTVVSSKNYKKINGILKNIKDIDCVWKLVQFNPRECPPEHRKEYQIELGKYIKVVDEISKEKELIYPGSKIRIGKRIYSGDNEPYCILILNSSGDILLPKGEEHIKLSNIFEKTKEVKKELSEKIHLGFESSKLFEKSVGPDNNINLLTYFYRSNQMVFNEGHDIGNFNNSISKLNKLINTERALLANIKDWYDIDFCDNSAKRHIIAFEKFKSILDNTDNNYNQIRFLFGQEKVCKILFKEWGILGGQTIILNNKGADDKKRVYPFIDHSPLGLEIPNTMNYSDKKMGYFKLFFKGVTHKENPRDRRKLPHYILKAVVDNIVKINKTENNKYLNTCIKIIKKEKTDKFNETTRKVLNMIMIGCIESSSEKIFGKSPYVKNDPLYRIFYDLEVRKDNLSLLEQKLDVLIISPEEAVLSIFFNRVVKNNVDISDFFHKTTLERLKKWICYQNKNNNEEEYSLRVNNYKCPPKCKDRDKCNFSCFSNNYKKENNRLLAQYWDFLFSPLFEKYDNEDLLNLMPTVLFIPFDGSEDDNEINSTCALYLKSNNFKKFWVNGKMWESEILTDDLRTYILNLNNFVSPLVYHNTSLEIQSELKKNEETIKRFAMKSAVSAVMSRNMSHNIGSHSLSSFSSRTSIQEIVDNSWEKYQYGKLDKNIDDSHDEFYKDGKIAVYNSYLRTRMDFLADLATAVPSVESPVYLFGELMRDFDKNILLLNTISGTKDFKYNFKLLNDSTSYVLDPDSKLEGDELVSIPNDTLGSHAFYVILENIIRNCAKHGGQYYDDKPEITIKASECREDETLITIDIFDNKTDEDIDNLVKEQNNNINLPIIEDDELRKKAWGVLEMKVSAAYLRKITSDQIDNPEYQLNINHNYRKSGGKIYHTILKAIHYKENGNNGFGYRFYLMKPKEILLINFNDKNSFSDSDIKNYKGHGIWILQENELSNTDIYSHQFLVIYGKPDINGLKKIISSSRYPLRIILTDNNSDIDKDNKYICVVDSKDMQAILFNEASKSYKEKSENIIGFIWDKWCYNLIDKNREWNPNFQYYQDLNVKKDTYNKTEYVFDDHGAHWLSNKNNSIYYEPFSSLSRTSKILAQFNIESTDTIKGKLYESVLTRIGIIDERIQEASEKMFYSRKTDNPDEEEKKMSYKKIFEKTGVVIPDKTNIDLKEKIFQSNGDDNIKKKLEEKWFKDNLKTLDFLIIHLGIIEKLIPVKDKNDDPEIIKKYICDNIKNHNNKLNIIIVSGRGKPQNLPEEFSFLNYSVLANACIDNREKYLLTQIVFSARKPLNNNE
jgi:MoaA/NifB/PqqE/SkfB family radical SAM enzyme